MSVWFYAKEGKQMGPVDEATLRQLVSEGEIPSSSLVWRQGMAQWTPFSQITDLSTGAPNTLGAVEAANQAAPVSSTVQVPGVGVSPAAPNNNMALWGFILGIA